MARTFRIGLTGGIASGKTTVAGFFAELGVPVVDADVVAREVVMPGTPGLAELLKAFGGEILDAKGALDRAAMRTRVFADAAARAKLESILHPLIRSAMDTQATTVGGLYQIFAIPLLVETHAQHTVDRVLVVDCPVDAQLERVMTRDGSTRTQAEAMLAAQASRDDRLNAADDVILNDSTLSSLRDKVGSLHKKYLELADQRLRDPTR